MKGMRPLTRIEVKSLLGNMSNLRDKTLLSIGFCTGFRISELLSLKLKDVCTAKGLVNTFIKVKASNTKTKEGRTVQLNTDAIKQLTTWINSLINKGFSMDTPLFVSRKHTTNGYQLKAISRIQAYEVIKNACELLGIIGNIGTHTMRKTFAARVYESVKKIELVQQALGHKSINSTISYLSFSCNEIELAIAGIFD